MARCAGTVAISPSVATSPNSVVLRFQASTAIAGAAGSMAQLHLGSSAVIGIQAEI